MTNRMDYDYKMIRCFKSSVILTDSKNNVYLTVRTGDKLAIHDRVEIVDEILAIDVVQDHFIIVAL